MAEDAPDRRHFAELLKLFRPLANLRTRPEVASFFTDATESRRERAWRPTAGANRLLGERRCRIGGCEVAVQGAANGWLGARVAIVTGALSGADVI